MTNRFVLLFFSIAVFLTILLSISLRYKVPINIVRFPDPGLHMMAETVTNFDEETIHTVDQLKGGLEEVDSRFHVFGLGLSAPQIGSNKRIIAIKTSYKNYEIMINPEIVEQKWLFPWSERCLSVDGRHTLTRALWVKVAYHTLSNEKREQVLIGPRAAVLQQEIDHLNGKLIIDHN